MSKIWLRMTKGSLVGDSLTCLRRRFESSVANLLVGQENEMMQTTALTDCSTFEDGVC